ncbi:Transposase for insertion sequence element IS200 [Lactiplantibacillus plantarum]|nr:Transposase for insertion sequence element IS200 [Lactiplantibacillus plantarum]MCG0815580.1 Transposase for insertion sequence element IS200 [Lactiplantibacillus plantarum]MCG0818821.1 Transposase for insertion sequence element IS200 [Lactiplantibacillus plantarum]MCG0822078.1 Transposase for insertion sequence element IS200 [Lactiplantibacillus plantarum]MCG0881471.1 Transposase for insertion sequence element IS200 [Lactiplantibacillus plantarum]
MPDHVHLLVSIPPKLSVASFIGYLKGKSAIMLARLGLMKPPSGNIFVIKKSMIKRRIG